MNKYIYIYKTIDIFNLIYMLAIVVLIKKSVKKIALPYLY